MMASFDDYFQNSPLCAQRPGLELEVRLEMTLFCYKPHCFSYVGYAVLMLTSLLLDGAVAVACYQNKVTQPHFQSKARSLRTQL